MKHSDDMRHEWLKPSLERILEPFLTVHPHVSVEFVEGALNQIADAPYSPPMPHWQYYDTTLPNSYMCDIGEDIVVVYQIFRGPVAVLGLIAVLD